MNNNKFNKFNHDKSQQESFLHKDWIDNQASSLQVVEDENQFDQIVTATINGTINGSQRVSVAQPSLPINTPSKNRTNNHNKNKLRDLFVAQQQQHGQIIQKLRSESKVKWKILFCFLFVKSAAIINLLAVSSLEETLSDDLNMNSVEFGLLTGVVFVSAAFGSLFVPYITERFNVYRASVLAQILLTVGQIVFVLGAWLKKEGQTDTTALVIMYISRVVFGLGFTLVQVCTYTVVSIWFGQSKWNSLALLMISQTVELGILLARYATWPIYNKTGSFWLAFGIGIVWAAFSIITTVISSILESNFNQFLNNYFQKQDFAFLKRLSINKTNNKPEVDVVLSSELVPSISHISMKVWLIMILICIGWSNIETYSSQMTDPLIDKYTISEDYADEMLSASTFVAFVIAPLVGWIASKLGRITLDVYMLFTQIAMLGSCVLYYYSDSTFLTTTIGVDAKIVGWISVFVFYAGLQTFYGGIFPLLFIECPAYLISVANSVNAFMYLICAFVEILVFGWIEDDSHHWNYSVLFLIGGLSFIGLVISVVLLCIVCKERKRTNRFEMDALEPLRDENS